MKDWLTIGQFSAKTGLTPKALRLYEEMYILSSKSRGVNGYRYYHIDQIQQAKRLKEFKDLGFNLIDIKNLLKIDSHINSEKIIQVMSNRLQLINQQILQLDQQKIQIENILSLMKFQLKPLKAEQRRAIMSFCGKVCIVVTGCEGLQKTAENIQMYYKNAGQDIQIINCTDDVQLPDIKPYILIINENQLKQNNIENLNPDVIVIKNFSSHNQGNQKNYLKLFTQIDAHVSTVLNADDRASVDFASQSQVKKGQIFYYSKNKALESQIRKIGGVLSYGDELQIFGFNLSPETVQIKIDKIMAFEDEIALLSSLGAIMSVGLEKKYLNI